MQIIPCKPRTLFLIMKEQARLSFKNISELLLSSLHFTISKHASLLYSYNKQTTGDPVWKLTAVRCLTFRAIPEKCQTGNQQRFTLQVKYLNLLKSAFLLNYVLFIYFIHVSICLFTVTMYWPCSLRHPCMRNWIIRKDGIPL